jgi:hypothetical protein
MTQKGVLFIPVVLAVVYTKRATAPASYLFIMSSSANASLSGKRKPATAAKTSNKNKGKGKDPASVIEEFGTTYGKIMSGAQPLHSLFRLQGGR